MRFSDTDGSVYNMRIEIPEFALLAMIRAISSGKTTKDYWDYDENYLKKQ